jgi:hypothetical protein
MPAYYGVKRKEARQLSYELANIKLQIRVLNKRTPVLKIRTTEQRTQKINELQQKVQELQKILWDMDIRPLHKKISDRTMCTRRMDIGFRV